MNRCAVAKVLFVFLFLLANSHLTAGIIETKNFRIRSALDERELREFTERILPSMEAFLTHWKKYGVELKTLPLDVIIQPDKRFGKFEALEMMYGKNYRDELKKLKGIDEVHEFSKKYPGFFRKSDLSMTKEELIEFIDVLSEHPTKKPKLIAGNHCSHDFGPVVFLGQSKNLDNENHGFLSLDVVLHEMSHALHMAVWEKYGFTERNVDTGGLNEMIADVLPALFLNDPCHGKIRNSDGVLACRRSLNTVQPSLSDSIFVENNYPHEMGRSVKYLFWNVYQSSGLDAMSRYTSHIIRHVAEKMLVYSNDAESKDPIVRKILEPRNNFQVLKYAAEELCRLSENGDSLCGDLSAIVGADVPSSYDIDNAPSRRWGSSQELMLGGKPVKIQFVPGQRVSSLLLSREGFDEYFEVRKIDGFSFTAYGKSGQILVNEKGEVSMSLVDILSGLKD